MDDRQSLTPRQREVLVLYAQGYRCREIAKILGIDSGTVRCHRSSLVMRLGGGGLPRAIVVGIARGEIVLDDEDVIVGTPATFKVLQAA